MVKEKKNSKILLWKLEKILQTQKKKMEKGKKNKARAMHKA